MKFLWSRFWSIASCRLSQKFSSRCKGWFLLKLSPRCAIRCLLPRSLPGHVALFSACRREVQWSSWRDSATSMLDEVSSLRAVSPLALRQKPGLLHAVGLRLRHCYMGHFRQLSCTCAWQARTEAYAMCRSPSYPACLPSLPRPNATVYWLKHSPLLLAFGYIT